VVRSIRVKERAKVNKMPAKSKAQARFMGAICGGAIKKKGLSKKKACEYTRGQKVSKLPARVKKKAKAKRRK